MAFIAIFNNISVISWRSVLLVEETGEPRESHLSAARHGQTLSHKFINFTLDNVNMLHSFTEQSNEFCNKNRWL
jgi:hypothetical protein